MVRAVARGEAVGTSDDLPPTIESALASRLDRLAPDARRMIDLAAAIGADVPLALLRATAPAVDVRNVTIAVKELIENELLEPARDRPDTLQFRHTLVQEVAYSRVLRRHARVLHLRSPTRSNGPTAVTATPVTCSPTTSTAPTRAPAPSTNCCDRRNGRKECSRTTPRSSTSAGPESWSCATTRRLRARPELTLRLADLHRQVGAYADAGELYRSLLDGPAAVRAACGLAASLRTQGDYRDALDVLDGGATRVPCGTRVDQPRARSLPHGRRQLPRRDRFLRRGTRRRPGRRSDARATLLSDLARAESSVGLLEDALGHGLEARRAFEESGDLRRLSSAQRVLGGVYEDLGRLDDAAAVLRDGLALSERIGHVEEAAGCLVNLALVELARGEFDAAIDCNRRAIAELARIGHPALATANANLAEALLARGDVDEVREYCDRAIVIAMKSGDMLTVADAGLTSAIADLRSGRTKQARESAELAASRFVEVGAVEWAAKALRDRRRVLRSRRRRGPRRRTS